MEADSWWNYSTDVASPDSESDSNSIWGDVWDWVGSESGTSVLSGALKSGVAMVGAEQSADAIEDASIRNTQESRDRTARVNQHNVSINKPLTLDIRKFKKP